MGDTVCTNPNLGKVTVGFVIVFWDANQIGKNKNVEIVHRLHNSNLRAFGYYDLFSTRMVLVEKTTKHF